MSQFALAQTWKDWMGLVVLKLQNQFSKILVLIAALVNAQIIGCHNIQLA